MTTIGLVSLWIKAPHGNPSSKRWGTPSSGRMRGASPTGWRPESPARSVPPSFAGREDPPRTPSPAALRAASASQPAHDGLSPQPVLARRLPWKRDRNPDAPRRSGDPGAAGSGLGGGAPSRPRPLPGGRPAARFRPADRGLAAMAPSRSLREPSPRLRFSRCRGCRSTTRSCCRSERVNRAFSSGSCTRSRSWSSTVFSELDIGLCPSGGAAASRGYLRYRFPDHLDLFADDAPDFGR